MPKHMPKQHMFAFDCTIAECEDAWQQLGRQDTKPAAGCQEKL